MKEQFDLGMWLTLIVWPALIGLLGFQIKTRSSVFKEVAESRQDLSNHKLHVAEDYVSKAALKDTEERLVRHLDRIQTSVEKLSNCQKEE